MSRKLIIDEEGVRGTMLNPLPARERARRKLIRAHPNPVDEQAPKKDRKKRPRASPKASRPKAPKQRDIKRKDNPMAAKKKNPRRVAAGKRTAARLKREGKGIFSKAAKRKARKASGNPITKSKPRKPSKPASKPRSKPRKRAANPTGGAWSMVSGLTFWEWLASIGGLVASVGIPASLTAPKPGEKPLNPLLRFLMIGGSSLGLGGLVGLASQPIGRAIRGVGSATAVGNLIIEGAQALQTRGKFPAQIRWDWSPQHSAALEVASRTRAAAAAQPATQGWSMPPMAMGMWPQGALGNVKPQAGVNYAIPFFPGYDPAMSGVLPQAGVNYAIPQGTYNVGDPYGYLPLSGGPQPAMSGPVCEATGGGACVDPQPTFAGYAGPLSTHGSQSY